MLIAIAITEEIQGLQNLINNDNPIRFTSDFNEALLELPLKKPVPNPADESSSCHSAPLPSTTSQWPPMTPLWPQTYCKSCPIILSNFVATDIYALFKNSIKKNCGIELGVVHVQIRVNRNPQIKTFNKQKALTKKIESMLWSILNFEGFNRT